VSEPVIKRRRRILVDGEVVGWIVRREPGLYRAYIAAPGGFATGDGSSRKVAAEYAWSARCVLYSRCNPPTEEMT
jgi:hypothetical protein